MNTQSPSIFTKCVQCNELASQVCGSCNNAPGIGDEVTRNTYYCNAQCQSANWTAHKSACKRLRTIKALYRADSLLQQVFYVYREKLFDRPVVQIEVTGTLEERNMKMGIYEGEYLKVITTKSEFLTPFPSGVCKTLEEKHALLSYLCCTDTVCGMHDMIEYLLKDVVSNYTKMAVKSKNRHLIALRYAASGQTDPDNFPHAILKAELKNGGESYIMDFAAAQHGHFEPIVPEIEYSTQRISSVLDSYHFGWSKEAFGILARMGAMREAGVFQEGFWDALKGNIQAWEDEVKVTVQAMLQLPDAAFEMRSKQLVEFLSAKLQHDLDRFAVRGA